MASALVGRQPGVCEFLEALLAPAARPPNVAVVGWRAGDVLLFDNLATQHSVTPSHRCGDDAGYAAIPGERRLMTRTAMQPTVPVLNNALAQ